MKKDCILSDINVSGLSHDLRGIAHHQGKTIFIQNALPGETVTLRYLAKHRQYDEAEAIEIVNPATDRTAPLCPHYQRCGGCSAQHIAPPAQLAHKQKILLEQLQHFGHVIPQTVLPPLTGPVWSYRRKARLGVKFLASKNQLMVGFREKQGRYITDLTRCETLDARLGQRLQPLKAMLEQLPSKAFIPQIEVAMGDHDMALVVRHLQALSSKEKDIITAFAKEHAVTIYLQPNDLQSIHPLWPASPAELSYHLPPYDLKFNFHPCDFTQVNASVNQAMLAQALHYLELNAQDKVLDLFCGIGNFTLPIARFCQHVVGVEGEQNAILRAKQNATLNQLNNVEFYSHDLSKTTLPAAIWTQQRYDKVLLDPPRSGALAMVRQLSHFAAQKIVYISCNPATLARDAGELVHQQGYKLTTAGIMDMFPQTSHVESIAVFEKLR